MASEYICTQNLNFCKLHRSQRQLIGASTLQQNDIVERKDLYLLQTLRNHLSAKRIPIYLGDEVVHVGSYIFNRVRAKFLYNFHDMKFILVKSQISLFQLV